ncbi:MAG: three-Cys-motif partner protein TcmP [Candidatus Hydrogenedentes bacterium]|nr:three-Cys-motif partner protein TcmP [Candidatus Hydrogenedentota bacterium]
MAKRDVLWPIEPHTKGKHLVLENYLAAWWPIMASSNKRVLFIDGFAGPGKYSGEEDGSPIIAMRSLLNSPRRMLRSHVQFRFIEADSTSAEHLKSLCERWKESLPPNCGLQVIPGAFDEHLTSVMDDLEKQSTALDPAFVMIDPFGVSGTPMSVVRRIFKNPRSEVLITYMYEYINRFKSTYSFEHKLDELYGCANWRQALEEIDPARRDRILFDVYEKQLRAAGARYVLRFNLFKGGRLFYALFFGTQDLTGCDKMKQAMWKVAPDGDFAFHGYHTEQLTLGLETVDFVPLMNELSGRFRNSGWVKIEEIENFVRSDETDYHSGHLKVKTLRPMESEGTILVDEKTRRRKFAYTPGTRIRFV